MMGPEVNPLNSDKARGQRPPLTIAMPVKDGERYLAEALASLANQSHGNLIILVSDNASSDQTPAILDQSPLPLIRFRQDHSLDVLDNYRFLLARVETEVVAFAAYDDLWDGDYFARLHDALLARPRAALAVGDVRLFGPDGAELRRRPLMPAPAETFARIASNLREVQAGWFYGLWRTNHLKQGFARLDHYPWTWAADHIVLQEAAASDSVLRVSGTWFHQRDTGLTKQRWRPGTPALRARQYLHFARLTWGALAQAPVGSFARLALRLRALAAADGKVDKARRILRDLILARS